MKKILCLLFVIVATLAVFTACNKDKEALVITESDEFVVIKCQTDEEGLTLVDLMDGLDDSFVIKLGMVVSINGLENASDWSACWMLYTDDSEFSNTAWGTAEHEGKIYGSAMYGAEDLIVKKGCTYIWVYKTF